MADITSEGEAVQQSAGAKAASPKKKMTKKDAVRRSLAKLGEDAKPKAIQADIRKRFKIEMDLGHISTTKGEIRREREGKPKKLAAATEQAAPPAARTSKQTGTAVAIDDILALRTLLDRVGADHLRALIDALSGGAAK
jgi:hypothetical protein